MYQENVEATKQLSYVRTFSDLGKYQKEYEVRYDLYQEKEKYIIEVQQIAQELRAERVVLALPKDRAMQMLTFLYENAVSVELCNDVILDLQRL